MCQGVIGSVYQAHFISTSYRDFRRGYSFLEFDKASSLSVVSTLSISNSSFISIAWSRASLKAFLPVSVWVAIVQVFRQWPFLPQLQHIGSLGFGSVLISRGVAVVAPVTGMRRILAAVRVVVGLIVAFVSSASFCLARYELSSFRRYSFVAFKVVNPLTVSYKFLRFFLNLFRR